MSVSSINSLRARNVSYLFLICSEPSLESKSWKEASQHLLIWTDKERDIHTPSKEGMKVSFSGTFALRVHGAYLFVWPFQSRWKDWTSRGSLGAHHFALSRFYLQAEPQALCSSPGWVWRGLLALGTWRPGMAVLHSFSHVAHMAQRQFRASFPCCLHWSI